MDEEAFVTALGALFEHSPWVARAAWRHRPFAGVPALHAAFEDAMRAGPRERQLALIGAHPELAGREAEEGELTDESSREQASAGLDRLSASEHSELTRLNRDYRERFGFPLVICVREHTKDSILSWGRARVERSLEQEIATALGEITKIAHLRLQDLVSDDTG
ncbi:MAG: 2-oxo-4-hydroxy-4-carboxy-5-ureidoimidazoline decarboxylase [Solirubrobacteraceae bacterium]